MNDANENDLFVQNTKVVYDNSLDTLDSATRAKLNQARQRALANVDKKSRAWPLWAPAGGLAAAALATFIMVNHKYTATGLELENNLLLSANEEFVQSDDAGMIEDIEFITWLSDVEDDTHAG
jgi:hypothetical protein